MNPERAHALVQQAVQDGRLVRQPCEVGRGCSGRVVAHHDDYSRPLDVRWLCDRHHRLHHSGGRSKVVLIRAKLSRSEWNEIRKIAIDRGVPLAAMLGDALRDALLKGAKP